MKKIFRYLLLLVSVFFIGASLLMLNHQKAQRTLEGEVKKAMTPLLEIQDILFQTKEAEDAKKKE
ncbi:MAG: hypothetical protein ACI4UF_08310, partial [Thermoguttaceae bacterium]